MWLAGLWAEQDRPILIGGACVQRKLQPATAVERIGQRREHTGLEVGDPQASVWHQVDAIDLASELSACDHHPGEGVFARDRL